jgi:hypothetical protein
VRFQKRREKKRRQERHTATEKGREGEASVEFEKAPAAHR